jgi:hypothetical protein
MNKITSLLFFLAMTASPAFALSGGPFDNGGTAARLEDGAVYQAVLSFRGGSGFCYFHPEQSLVPEDISVSNTTNIRGSIQNRSVIYYKGISYVGGAFGMSDPDSRYISCIINGNSDITTSNTTSNQNTNNQGGLNTSTVSITNSVVSSNRGFVVNGQWEARMNQMAPTRRFTGKGELVFVPPTGTDAVAGLAFSGYAGLIQAIVQSVGGVTDFTETIIDVYGTAQAAINNALAALPGFLTGAGLDAVQDSGDTVRLRVRGTIRYR